MSLEEAKQYIKEICDKKMEKYPDLKYKVSYSGRLKRVLGKHKKAKTSRTHEILFSKYWAEELYKRNKRELRAVVLHELGHAITAHEYGAGHGHDSYWKKVVKRLGGKPERLFNTSAVKVERPYKHLYKCPNCGKETKVYRAYTGNVACGSCCRKYNNGKYSKKYVLELVESF